MRKAEIYIHGILAGELLEEDSGGYIFHYLESYQGPSVSLTMPLSQRMYSFKQFPPFFEGLLPEGAQLEALLRQEKLDRNDFFGQITTVGNDLVGAITIKRASE